MDQEISTIHSHYHFQSGWTLDKLYYVFYSVMMRNKSILKGIDIIYVICTISAYIYPYMYLCVYILYTLYITLYVHNNYIYYNQGNKNFNVFVTN